MIGYYPINPGGSMEDAFGPRFFKQRFYAWIREACNIDGRTPVLEVMLTSGQVIDISHIVELRDDYLLVCAFEDVHDCSRTYHTYLRYLTIYRINVLSQPRDERPIGFNVTHNPRIVNASGKVDLDEIVAEQKKREKDRDVAPVPVDKPLRKKQKSKQP